MMPAEVSLGTRSLAGSGIHPKRPAGEEVPMPNRLIDETSPYLLQHAENPVDWYPWGDEAFAAGARPRTSRSS